MIPGTVLVGNFCVLMVLDELRLLVLDYLVPDDEGSVWTLDRPRSDEDWKKSGWKKV